MHPKIGRRNEPVCEINHKQSSGSMEKEGAVEMFVNSVTRRKLKYVEYVEDGDTNSFGAVAEALLEKFGDQYPIIKEDCIGHIQKRMGAALRNYKSECRGSKLADGKTVGGAGMLTDKVVDLIQTYYGCAIRNNQGIENIAQAIRAIYYHMICCPSDESLEEQHLYCPNGPESWCKYKKDKINITDTYSRTKCLPIVFRKELKPIFIRLSSTQLLETCSKGLTQNQNESLNNVLWSKCSKRMFVGYSRFKLAVCEAVTTFNDGAKARQSLLEGLELDCGRASKKLLHIQNKVRLQNSRIKVTEKYRKQRQKLHQIRKGKWKDVTCYIPGGFSTKLVPDAQSEIDFAKNNEVEITCIHDDDMTSLFY